MAAPPTQSASPEPARAERVLAQLSLDEKASLTAGRDVWHLPAIEGVGLGALKMSDGPSGVRGERIGQRRSLAFACGMAAGATWDVDLLSRYGTALAAEARSKGVHLLLGPTVCIPRMPLAGRTFESFAEDPCLSARLTVAYIRAVQAGGVGCCVKHFACNDQEHERMTISAEVDERTLREIHLPSFEAAVREAGTWAVMSAYNKLNGIHCAEHPQLLGAILKDEWQFDGVVVSDWWGTHSTLEAASAGLDIEMPGPGRHLGALLAAAAERGEIDPAVIDEHARRVLVLAERCGALDGVGGGAEAEDDDESRRALARELVESSCVLLKNEGVLPLVGDKLRRVALIGPNAAWLEVGGGGSAAVTALRETSLLDELRAHLPDAEVVHAEGCRIDRGLAPIDARLLGEGLALDYFVGGDLDGAPVGRDRVRTGQFIAWGDPVPGVSVRDFSLRARGTLTPDVSGTWQVAIANTGTARLVIDGRAVIDNARPVRGLSLLMGDGEPMEPTDVELEAGRPYELVVEFESGHSAIAGFQLVAARPAVEGSMERAAAAAQAADVAVVVIGSNRHWETEGRDRADLRLVGEQDELVRRVAAANPNMVVVVNAGSPVEMPWAERVGAILMLWYPGEEGAPALARILTGAAEPGGRLPITFPARLEDSAAHGWYPGSDGRVVYGEGTLVGYRHFDARGLEPAFCFGHGLSYTSFDYGPPSLTVEGRRVSIALEVTNTGLRKGSDVVQVYVSDLEASVPRAPRELKGFAKVDLGPGETTTVELALDDRSFAFWDVSTHDWRVEPGTFEIAVGRSSRDIRHVANVEIA
jgi:beta-glucosidase